jgi:hypothetical protein
MCSDITLLCATHFQHRRIPLDVSAGSVQKEQVLMYTAEHLRTLQPQGAPAHILQRAQGLPTILLCKFYPGAGSASGTQLGRPLL